MQWHLFLLGAATEFLLMNIMNYGHYSMITFPLLPIAIYELKRLSTDALKYVKILSVLVLFAVTVIASFRTGKEAVKLYRCYENYGTNADPERYIWIWI